jgi:hypothetical protein
MSQVLRADFSFWNRTISYEMLRQNSYFETLTLASRAKRNATHCEDLKQGVEA